MRFVRLQASHFAAIEHAEVELGPGLNVLHGPNDLGKSTLAAALRAALLLPHTSSEADAYVPWRGDFTPRVELTFVDAAERFWRVSKSFGSGTRGSSVLESSKDGRDFVGEAKGREVDDRLRKLLEWGVADAAARTGPRGLPQSFLSHVLLAEQTDVDKILGESLEADPGESGKLRLTRALQAFARDPRFTKLLDQADANVDRLFSATGKPKRGKDSPFQKAAEGVRQLHAELEDLGAQLRATDEAEGRLKLLRDDVGLLAARQADAERALARARSIADAQSARDDAVANLAVIEAAHARVGEKARELATLAAAAEARERELRDAKVAEEAARQALAKATEAQVQATSQKAAGQRAIRKAELQTTLANLETEERDLDARRKEAEQAAELASRVGVLEREREALDRKTKDVRSRLEKARQTLEEARASRQQLQSLLAYGRWAAAASDLELLRAARAEARQESAAADEASQQAAAFRSGVAERALPDAAVVKAIQDLDQELRLAEAALGGGLSATLRLRKGMTIDVRVDEGDTRKARDEETVEASRAIELTVGDVADIRILAGDAGKRRLAEALRQRWNAEARPLLALAGADTASALADARAKADELLRRADTLDRDARHLAEKAAEKEVRAAEVSRLEKRVADLDLALKGCDRDALAGLVRNVKGWETQTETAERKLEQQEKSSRDDESAAAKELAGVDGRLTQLDESLARAKDDADRARASVGDEPATRLDTLEKAKAGIAGRAAVLRAELEKLESAASKAVASAKALVEQAQQASSVAANAARDADDRAKGARSDHDKAGGELATLRRHADELPRGDAEDRVSRCGAALRELDDTGRTISAVDLRDLAASLMTIEADLAARRADLNQAEGALTQVGGAVVRERHQSTKAAALLAESGQAELELDANAWKLLRDTLRDSEATGVQHLGKALGADVGRRFGELTGKRYGDLDLDPGLRVQGIESAGDVRSLDTLSAGTRDQLATLLRLAIAESLGTAIVLDDQLVHTDPARLEWFRAALLRAAALVQVVVVTCRRGDYAVDTPGLVPRNIRFVDLAEKIRRVATG